jgi:hypothetical protein
MVGEELLHEQPSVRKQDGGMRTVETDGNRLPGGKEYSIIETFQARQSATTTPLTPCGVVGNRAT